MCVLYAGLDVVAPLALVVEAVDSSDGRAPLRSMKSIIVIIIIIIIPIIIIISIIIIITIIIISIIAIIIVIVIMVIVIDCSASKDLGLLLPADPASEDAGLPGSQAPRLPFKGKSGGPKEGGLSIGQHEDLNM